MNPSNDHQDHLFLELGLALLELIDKQIDLELEQPAHAEGLVLNGTLLRAFDTPSQADISMTIGSHTISIRPSQLKTIHITRSETQTRQLQSVHITFTDHFQLHIKPKPPTKSHIVPAFKQPPHHNHHNNPPPNPS